MTFALILLAAVAAAVAVGWWRARQDAARVERASEAQAERPDQQRSSASEPFIRVRLVTTATDAADEPTRSGAPRLDAGRSEDKDAWEGWFWDAVDPVPIAARLRIRYVDAEGNRTFREVLVRKFDRANATGLVIAHCQLRNATRTFRMDRIQAAVDLETGEIVPKVFDWLRDRYAATPHSAAEDLAVQHDDVLQALIYVGKADGRFTAKEKAVVADWAAKVSGDARFDVAMVSGLLADYGTPTLNGFRAAVRRLAPIDPAVRASVMAAARAMVATQKKVSPEEQGALDYMAKHLEAPGQKAAPSAPAS